MVLHAAAQATTPDVQSVLSSHTAGLAGSPTRFRVHIRKGNLPPGAQLQRRRVGAHLMVREVGREQRSGAKHAGGCSELAPPP